MGKRFSRRRYLGSPPAKTQVLEKRTLLSVARPALQTDGEAPKHLGDIDNHGILFIGLATTDGSGATRFYTSDGTQDGTTKFADLPIQIVGTERAMANGQVFFVARSDAGIELWKTDGSAVGTSIVKDLRPGAGQDSDSYPQELTVVDGWVYFSAAPSSAGRSLFRTDGTAAGTSQIGENGIGPKLLTEFDGQLFFASTSDLNMYRTDGTDVGTVVALSSDQVAHPTGTYGETTDFHDVGSYPIGEVNGRLVAHQIQTNGTLQNRQEVRLVSFESAEDSSPTTLLNLEQANIHVDYANFPNRYANLGNRILFEMDAWHSDSLVLRGIKNPAWDDLWTTDGTAAGTMVADMFITRTIQFDVPYFDGASFNGHFYTPVVDKWPNNGGPEYVSYDTPMNAGFTNSSHGLTVFDVQSGETKIRRPNADNSRLELLAAFDEPADNPFTMLDQVFFARNGVLWTLDDPTTGDGPEITLPGGNTSDVAEIEIQWRTSPAAINYDLRVVSVNANGVESLVLSAPELTSSTYQATLTEGQYSVQVRTRHISAIDGTGIVSEWSSVDLQVSLLPPTVRGPKGTTAESNPLIEWTAVPEASAYNLWIAENGRRFAVARNLLETSIRIEDVVGRQDPLIDGRQYRIWVQAVYPGSTVGRWSRHVDFTKLSDGLHPPLYVHLFHEPQTNPVRVEWNFPRDVPVDVEQFEIYINPVGDRHNAVYHETTTEQTSHTLTRTLEPGTYEVWVAAHFADESRTAWGQPRELIVSRGRPEFSKIEYTASTRRLDVDFTSVSDAVAYELWISRPAGGTEAVIHVTDLTESGFDEVVSLEPGIHTAWVRARFSDGNSRWSDQWGFDVQTSFLSPIAVTVLSGNDDSTPEVSWDEVPNAVRYELYVNPVNDRSNPVYHAKSLTSNTHELATALNSSGTYEFWVRAFTSHAQQTRWGTPTVFTLGQSFEDVYPALSVDGAIASWPAVSSAVRYEIWINEFDSAGNQIGVRVFHDTQLTGTSVNTPVGNGFYRAWLRAFDGNDRTTLWSAAVNFSVG